MMGLLTTLSLVGSLVLWAGYQAFYVPNNYTTPVADQNSLDDLYGGRYSPLKFSRKAAFHTQTASIVSPKVSSISWTLASSLFIKREFELVTPDFIPPSSTLRKSHTSLSPSSVLPFGELLGTGKIETKVSNDRNGDVLKDNASQLSNSILTTEFESLTSSVISNTGYMANHSTEFSENMTSEMKDLDRNATVQASGGGYINNNTNFDHFITTEDNHLLSTDAKVADHDTIEKQLLENLDRLVTDLPVSNDSLDAPRRINQSVSSLNMLYTLVTFVRNLEDQERGNFSKTFDSLLHSNNSKIRNTKGTAKPVVTQDIAKDLVNSSGDQTEPEEVTEGLSEIEEFRHNKLGITPAERIASEDAKVLSKEYMDHFGWQGYLLIFFIIVIVLLLITTLILFGSSYFTWRNRQKQTKTDKASNSHKEA